MLPYGISDFKKIRETGLYYIDKTHFIPLLEQWPPYLFLIRPRRFGKSLFISMLEAYYDINQKDAFDKLFKGTYIHEQPTKLRNSHFVLRFDFSAVDSSNADNNFNVYANQQLGRFAAKYGMDVNLKYENVNNNLNELFSYCSLRKDSIYVLVDEYDNFINELLVKDEAEYRRMVTGQEAKYKQFFRTLKAGTSGLDAPVKRMFITGVSPLALYDVTSGYNIGTNITTNEAFNDILGVTPQELSTLLREYELEYQQDAIRARMDEWYNGYRFSDDVGHTIYDTDMALYYLHNLVQSGKEPKELIDLNVRSDYSKIRFLVQTDRKLNGNFSVLNGLLADGSIEVSGIKDSFSAFELRKRENFVSLLFYLGLITIDRYELGLLYLPIPNQTIRKIMGGFVQKTVEENDLLYLDLDHFNRLLRDLGWLKKLDVFHYLAERLQQQSKIRDYMSGESFVRGFLAAYFSLNAYYEVSTEQEASKGFVDIYLRPSTPDVPHGVGIELKYIKRKELTEALLAQKTEEALAQLGRYELPEHTVKVALIFHGWELVAIQEA